MPDEVKSQFQQPFNLCDQVQIFERHLSLGSRPLSPKEYFSAAVFLDLSMSAISLIKLRCALDVVLCCVSPSDKSWTNTVVLRWHLNSASGVRFYP